MILTGQLKLSHLLTWAWACAVLVSGIGEKQQYWKDLAARLHTGSRVEPPSTFFQSINQDLEPWRDHGITNEQVSTQIDTTQSVLKEVMLNKGVLSRWRQHIAAVPAEDFDCKSLLDVSISLEKDQELRIDTEI